MNARALLGTARGLDVAAGLCVAVAVASMTVSIRLLRGLRAATALPPGELRRGAIVIPPPLPAPPAEVCRPWAHVTPHRGCLLR